MKAVSLTVCRGGVVEWRHRAHAVAVEDGGVLAAARHTRPQLVGGEGASDTALMPALPGWTAKRGAEGMVCAASSEGLGVAVKVEDGGPRAVRSALARFLAALGVELGETFAHVPVLNARAR